MTTREREIRTGCAKYGMAMRKRTVPALSIERQIMVASARRLPNEALADAIIAAMIVGRPPCEVVG